MIQRALLIAGTMAAALPAAAQDAPPPPERRDNGVAIFAGIYSSDVFTDIVATPWDTRTENIYLVSLSYNRRLTTIFRHLDIEVEGGVGRRFGDNESFEAYAALALRWTEFPWNRHLRTTFAVYPIGPSYVADLSPSEVSKDGRSANWLNYFALELTLAAPSLPQLEVLFRLHHRSGAFGLINGSTNGADFLSVGARFRF
ncbi:hypothetical protein [Roseomonas sp. CECT 9278]|uniref:hypothetical protein n=1 Tax=Roseomonas sp. CECT 9278 TaxID=2845823 RepID=UPI001E47F198|nr:hypothetical protein [Roseomonas sp. CECT 9278]CAH0239182.1 hypothetical protein ROS9278_02848 [Roseomonas sp. CECT 9278]